MKKRISFIVFMLICISSFAQRYCYDTIPYDSLVGRWVKLYDIKETNGWYFKRAWGGTKDLDSIIYNRTLNQSSRPDFNKHPYGVIEHVDNCKDRYNSLFLIKFGDKYDIQFCRNLIDTSDLAKPDYEGFWNKYYDSVSNASTFQLNCIYGDEYLDRIINDRMVQKVNADINVLRAKGIDTLVTLFVLSEWDNDCRPLRAYLLFRSKIRVYDRTFIRDNYTTSSNPIKTTEKDMSEDWQIVKDYYLSNNVNATPRWTWSGTNRISIQTIVYDSVDCWEQFPFFTEYCNRIPIGETLKKVFSDEVRQMWLR